MFKIVDWISEQVYKVAVIILLIMTLFTTSISALRLVETPQPLDHYKVDVKRAGPGPNRPLGVILDTRSIQRERLEIPELWFSRRPHDLHLRL